MYVQKENTLHVSQDVVSVGSGEEKRREERGGKNRELIWPSKAWLPESLTD